MRLRKVIYSLAVVSAFSSRPCHVRACQPPQVEQARVGKITYSSNVVGGNSLAPVELPHERGHLVLLFVHISRARRDYCLVLCKLSWRMDKWRARQAAP